MPNPVYMSEMYSYLRSIAAISCVSGKTNQMSYVCFLVGTTPVVTMVMAHYRQPHVSMCEQSGYQLCRMASISHSTINLLLQVMMYREEHVRVVLLRLTVWFDLGSHSIVVCTIADVLCIESLVASAVGTTIEAYISHQYTEAWPRN